jgi:hypothetical protein
MKKAFISVSPKFLASVVCVEAAAVVLKPDPFCAKLIKASNTKLSVIKIFLDMVIKFLFQVKDFKFISINVPS